MPALLSLVLAVAGAVTPIQSAADWIGFVGAWRAEDTGKDPDPTIPFLLRIFVEGDHLVVERLTAGSTDTSRYRLDGASTRTVQAGRPGDGVVAIDQGTLTITTRAVLQDRRTATLKEALTVARNLMTVERSETIGARETRSTDVFRRLPGNFRTHGDRGVETGREP